MIFWFCLHARLTCNYKKQKLFSSFVISHLTRSIFFQEVPGDWLLQFLLSWVNLFISEYPLHPTLLIICWKYSNLWCHPCYPSPHSSSPTSTISGDSISSSLSLLLIDLYKLLLHHFIVILFTHFVPTIVL